jgi:hypothetical protein
VYHTGALLFTLKSILKGKRRVMEIQTFQHAKIYSSKKNPLNETKIPQDIS